MFKRLFYASGTLLLLALTALVFATAARALTSDWQGVHPKIAGMAYATDGVHQRIYTIDVDGNVYVRALWNPGTFGTPSEQNGGVTPIASFVGNFWERAQPLHD